MGCSQKRRMGSSQFVQFSDHHKQRKMFFSSFENCNKWTLSQAICRDLSNYDTFTFSERNSPPKISLLTFYCIPSEAVASEGRGRLILLFFPKETKTQFTSELAIQQELHAVASVGFSVSVCFSASSPSSHVLCSEHLISSGDRQFGLGSTQWI